MEDSGAVIAAFETMNLAKANYVGDRQANRFSPQLEDFKTKFCTPCGWSEKGWTACANANENRPGALYCVPCNKKLCYVPDVGDFANLASAAAFIGASKWAERASPCTTPRACMPRHGCLMGQMIPVLRGCISSASGMRES